MASKSLGTLTLDLVAKIGAFTGPLDKASREAKKRNDEIAKSFSSLAKGVGTAIGSIPAVLAALVVHSASVAKEISNQSALAGLGTTDFQKYAAAAKSVGVEQDKLSDIFKDTNDKLGDFASTGAGELKDFFENIAPKVGVTAESFKKLNSKDALALYVTSLEKANVSQQEMTFYMESIADDSTALVPLLRNSGKAFDELGQAALNAGVVMDESTIAAAKQFGIELQGLGQYITAGTTMLAAEFLPVLAQFSKDMNQSAKDAGGLKGQVGDLGDKLVETGAFLASAGDGVIRVFDIVANTLVGMFSTAVGHTNNLAAQANSALGLLTFGDTSKQFKINAAAFASDAQIQFSIAAQAADKIKENLEKPLAGDRFKEYVANAKKAAAEVAAATKGVTPGTGTGIDPAAREKAKKAAQEAEASAKKINDTFKSSETDLQRQIALINTSADAQKKATEVDKLRFEIASGKLVGINADQQKRLQGLARELDALQKLKVANEDEAKSAAFLANLKATNATTKSGFDMELAGAGMGDKARDRLQQDLAIQQDYNEQMADLQKQLNAGDITADLYATETGMLKDALTERMELQHEYYESLDAAQSNWMDGVNEAWANFADAAEDYSQMAADLTSSALGSASSNLGTFFSDVATGAEDAGDALGDMIAGFGKSMVNALSDMAAQWLVYQAVQLIVGKTTQSAAGLAMVANAQATSAQAALAAYASTAAIPIVGPALAPGAALAAQTATIPMVAAVSSAALAGMAHDGIDAVPETGTWLLEKGERVTTAETSAKLDRTLERINSGSAGASSGAAAISINAPITVQAQKGMSDQEAQQQGESMGQAFTAEVIRIIQGETLQGGVLWRRV
ncbi:phage tail tape measure protein [Pseudomonas sp. NFACC13-1]|uniref:phage tail tape measure protein n=1 Tax=Pseudomonas sp. NFACC13-1 TaxID=1566245 RepID=UPI00087EBF3C|nr:phage tail tape measure protein [Pseudomonas sp. NFACC13-1]SDB54443.1 phage tail tape measure protein, lambda family [Pseudomonas sp. NFACC13-1]